MSKYFTLGCQDLPAAKELSSAGYQNVIIVVGVSDFSDRSNHEEPRVGDLSKTAAVMYTDAALMEEQEISQNMGAIVLVCTAASLLRNTSLNQSYDEELYEMFAAGPLDTLNCRF